MSLWEFMAFRDGYLLSKGEKIPGGEGMSDERARELGIEGF